MFIVLSISDIIDGLYALTAMVSITGGTRVPALLHRDHAPALERIVINAFTLEAAALTPWIVHSDITIRGQDLLSLELCDDASRRVNSSLLREWLRQAVEGRVLQCVWAGVDPVRSQAFGAHASLVSDMLRAGLVHCPADELMRIEPDM